MSWLRVEARFPTHPKVVGLSDAAFRLHVCAMGYCREHETDGRVLVAVSESLTRHSQKTRHMAITQLVDVGLWEPVLGGWQIHDFLDWNPSKAQLDEQRKAAQERMQRSRSPSVRSNGERTSDEVAAVFERSRARSRAGTGTGVGSDLGDRDPDPVRQLPRRTPIPPRPPHPDPDIAQVAEAIRRERRLVAVHHDADDIAEHDMPVTLRKPVAWYLQAVHEAARDTPSGEAGHLTLKRVGSYLANAKGPKRDEAPRSERTVTYTYHDKGASPELVGLTAGIGKGPK